MKNSKFLVAVIVVLIGMFAVGALNYGFLLKDFYRTHTGISEDIYGQVFKADDQMNWGAAILSNLASALMLTTVLVWGGFTSTASGARAGAILCLLMGIAVDFGFISFTNVFTVTGAIVDVIVNAVMGAIVGALGGMVLAKGIKTATA
jgi:hypothetical protein